MKNLTDKTKIFEELIKELKPITRKSKEVNYGQSSTSKSASEHCIEFSYNGCKVKVELK